MLYNVPPVIIYPVSSDVITDRSQLDEWVWTYGLMPYDNWNREMSRWQASNPGQLATPKYFEHHIWYKPFALLMIPIRIASNDPDKLENLMQSLSWLSDHFISPYDHYILPTGSVSDELYDVIKSNLLGKGLNFYIKELTELPT